MRENEKPLSQRELAEYLKISPLTVQRRATRGEIPFMRINKRGDKVFYLSEVLEVMEKQYN